MMIKHLQVKQEQLKGNGKRDIDMAVAEGKLTKAHHDEIVQLREQNKELEENKRKEEENAREKKRAAKEAENAAKQAAKQAQRDRERKEASGLALGGKIRSRTGGAQ
ncbi:hypothetical protein [Escherichia coli]|uniref:hypothetical protein n=1 Tax=Escherichia coli TaxID=562 RepID=UPI00106C797D|nr:hypothetical protein [Escherichia coli]VFT03666.1 Uncharacterised protein [Escherichia coli]